MTSIPIWPPISPQAGPSVAAGLGFARCASIATSNSGYSRR